MRAFLALAVVVAVGCGSNAAPDASPREAQSAAGQPEGEVAAAVPDADGYAVGVEAPAQAAAGQPVIARVSVQPNAPWHMNEDFPAKLRMSATQGIELDAALLQKNDAERLDSDALVFPVVFTPQAGHTGRATLTGEVHFAVCGVAECNPVKVPVEFSLEIT